MKSVPRKTTGKWERALYTMAQADAETARRKAQRFLESIGRFSAFLVQSAVRADHSVKFEKNRIPPNKVTESTAKALLISIFRQNRGV